MAPFLKSLIDLAACETLDALLDEVIVLLERELELRGSIELSDLDGTRFVRGEHAPARAAHCTWIGVRYTIGAIYLHTAPPQQANIELLARQLAPIAELLIEKHASERRTIRQDIDRLYERRIRESLVESDWNASAVARRLCVSRARVAKVTRRWGRR